MLIFGTQHGSIRDLGLDISWDASSFAAEVSRRAALLAKMNIGPGSLVGITHNGTAHFFADLFATWALGATAASLDSHLTDAELKIITEFAKPAVLLASRTSRAFNLSVPAVDLEAAPRTDSNLAARLKPDDPALVLFTSGTTGNPKGVTLTFRALSARISANIGVIGKATVRRTLVALPTHFGHGLIGNSLTPFLNGGEIVLHPLGLSLASNLGRLIDTHQIKFMSSVPALWHLAKSHSEPPTRGSLRRVHVGSAPLSEQLWSDIAAWSGAEVVNCYGLTETANWIAGASSRTDGISEGLVGRSWGSTIAVKDDTGDVKSVGEGEIVVQTPGLMAGYFRRPDLTSTATQNGWFHTGDRGTVDDDRRIWLTGRIKDEINRGGMKIQPAEIDTLLERHPAISEACTFGIPDPVSREAVAVLVKFEKGASANPESLHAWCRERLRPSAVPERWFIVDEIPRNSRGKVNRDAVRRIYAEQNPTLIPEVDVTPIASPAKSPLRAQTTSGEAATGRELENIHAASPDVRQVVRRAWIEILGASTFAADQTWIEAGGDSLDLLRLWFRIEQALGQSLPMDAIPENVRPSEIVAAIEGWRAGAKADAKSKVALNQPPLVFFMPPADGDLPRHARFRGALEGKVRFAVIRYPTWQQMLTGEGSFDAIVNAAISQIYEHQKAGPYFLVGYSFGGFVAWEVACHLLRSGGQVAFVGLIDTRRAWDHPSIDRPEPFRRGTLASVCRFVKSALLHPTDTITIRWLLPPLIDRRAFWLLRPIGRFTATRNSKAAFEFSFRLTYQLRHQALRAWELSAAPIPITLFRSQEFHSELPDYGWSMKAARVEVMPISDSHLSLPENEELCVRFLEAVASASETTAASDHEDGNVLANSS